MPARNRNNSRNNKPSGCCEGHYGKKAMLVGVLFLVAGFLSYIGYNWSVILMIVGILLLVKGLMKSM